MTINPKYCNMSVTVYCWVYHTLCSTASELVMKNDKHVMNLLCFQYMPTKALFAQQTAIDMIQVGPSCWAHFTVYPKKYAHGFWFVVLCCGDTLTDFPKSIRLTSLALWQSNDCPSASKATLMNMDKYFMWIHYERLHSHNKAKHNKTVCIFLGIYCISMTLCVFALNIIALFV